MPRKTDPPAPPDDPNILALGLTTIEEAVARYWASLARRDDAYRRYQTAEAAWKASGAKGGLDHSAADRWESWTSLVSGDHSRARETLIEAILTWHGRSWNSARAIKTPARPKAVVVGGRAYVATPDPDDLKGEDVSADPHDSTDQMGLVVLPADAIADLDAMGAGA